MKALSDMSIFKYVEMVGSSKISKGVVALVGGTTSVKVTEEMLEDTFYKMRHKSFNHNAKFSVIELFRKGRIVLIYNPDVKLTVAYPFFKYKTATGYGVIINITNYSKMMEDNTIRIDPLILYNLMLSGAYMLGTNNYMEFISSGIPEFYADLIISVIMRMTTINEAIRDELKYLFRKFLYMQLGLDEIRASSAAANTAKDMPADIITALNESVPVAAFDNLEALMNAVRARYPQIASITFGNLFDRWMRSYGETTAFAIEYLPALSLMFIALVTNCNNLINVKSVEKEGSRRSAKFTALFNRIETIVNELAQAR